MSGSVNPDHISRTSVMVAAGRAIGARESDPAVRNPDWLAEQLIGPEIRALQIDHPVIQALDQEYGEVINDPEVLNSVRMMMVRTRFIDERLEYAVRNGVEQVVMLGAGFDSRAYRFVDLLKNVRVFEVDRPGMQGVKRRRVAEIIDTIPSNLTYVPVDFRNEKLDEALTHAGYDRNCKTFFIWEGVTMYLPEEAVRDTLRFVASHPAGSSIVFDFTTKRMIYFLKSVSVDQVQEALQPRVRRLQQLESGEPWIFGMPDEQGREFLEELGLRIGELLVIGGEESVKRYLTRSDGSMFGPEGHSSKIPYSLVEAIVIA